MTTGGSICNDFPENQQHYATQFQSF